jgi:NAD(P)-dependent dehydrogenase (short-subunit alcohol dehydrogenase family)
VGLHSAHAGTSVRGGCQLDHCDSPGHGSRSTMHHQPVGVIWRWGQVSAPGGDDVVDRVIVITGAGRGIGRGIAHHLARSGATIVVGELVPRRLGRIVDELSRIGGPYLGEPCDVRSKQDIEALIAKTVDRFGRIDGLVSNAVSYKGPQPLAEISDEVMDGVYLSGVKAALWGMQAVYPHMAAAGWGRIVNVGSSAGIVGLPGFGAYAAAKEAIRGLTRTAAREWAADGIIVNCYCPASYEERPTAEVSPYLAAADARFRYQHPSGRVGDAELDIGPVVRFLCSDACRYLTGETLMVDGGAYISA